MKAIKVMLLASLVTPMAWPSTYNESFDERFNDSQKKFLYTAIQKAYTGLFADRQVFNCVYRNANREMVDTDSLVRIYGESGRSLAGTLWDRQFNVFSTFVAANNILPDIHIGYFSDADTFAGGYANYGKVYTSKASNGNFQWNGKFEITINSAKLQGSQSIASWAGLIAHEMLHNLSNAHPSPKDVGLEQAYTRNLVINSVQSCVQAAADGYPNVHAPEMRCGGRVPE